MTDERGEKWPLYPLLYDGTPYVPQVAYEAERTRADAAEAQRDRLAAAGRAFMGDTEHVVDIREDGWAIQHPPLCRPSMLDCEWTKRATNWDEPPAPVGKWVLPLFGAITQRWDGTDKLDAFRAALADVPEEDVRLTAALDETAQWLHHVLHNWPGAAERFEACPVLPCCRNCEVLGRPYSGRVQDAALLTDVPVLMPTLTDEEHAAVERTLTRTQEARESRRRDEAYQAMVEACEAAQREAVDGYAGQARSRPCAGATGGGGIMPGCPKCGMQYLASHACPPVTLSTITGSLYVQVPDRYAEGYRAGLIAALREVGCMIVEQTGDEDCAQMFGERIRMYCRVCRLLAEAESGEDAGERA